MFAVTIEKVLPGDDDDDDTGDISTLIYKLQMMKLLKYSENTYHDCITSYVHRYTIFYGNNLEDWTLQYAILCHIYSCE